MAYSIFYKYFNYTTLYIWSKWQCGNILNVDCYNGVFDIIFYSETQTPVEFGDTQVSAQARFCLQVHLNLISSVLRDLYILYALRM